MRPFEEKVAKRLERDGWKVLRAGWPDLLCVRNNGGKTEVKAVEVKRPLDPVRPAQKLVHDALRAAGVDIVVENTPTSFMWAVEMFDPESRSWNAVKGDVARAQVNKQIWALRKDSNRRYRIRKYVSWKQVTELLKQPITETLLKCDRDNIAKSGKNGRNQ